jgi:signal transduction histidine kinase
MLNAKVLAADVRKMNQGFIQNGVAILLVAFAILLQIQIRPLIGAKAYLFLYPAVFFAALWGGGRTGMLATLLAGLSAWYFFLPDDPGGRLAGLSGADIFGLIVFGATGVLFSYFSDLFRSALEGERSALVNRERAIKEQKLTQAALMDAVRVRDEFLSIASHELKTPLTSLKLQLQMAQRSLRAPVLDPAALDRFSRGIALGASQVDRLATLVDSLLDVSRIQAGKLAFQFEPVDLSRQVAEVLERFSESFSSTNCPLDVKIEKDVVVRADRFRLEQVLVNLLTNALKYGGGKPVHVTLRKAEKTACLSVQDFGIGIDPALQEKIFDRFERGGLNRNISGLGLGLYISKQIVDGHEGRIHVKSLPGEGSTFVVEIPLADEAAAV